MTRVFYTYRNADKLRVPAAADSESAARALPGFLGLTDLETRDAVAAELADARGRLAALPAHRRLAGLRFDFELYITELERELSA